ncbi:MAG: 4-alpha-glucanotransferase, partial [Spirochaeta sp.]
MKNKLIFGTYNSLPVGTPESVLEEYYQSSYKPFLQHLYTHPQVQAAVYYCGTLLDWLSSHHSEFLDVLSEMVGRRQIEVIGGGFYEPILSMIPRQDRVGQIELMTTMLRKQFGRRPRGCWIPEMVWEPGLTSSLCSSGMEYTFLEESQFMRAGLRGDQL